MPAKCISTGKAQARDACFVKRCVHRAGLKLLGGYQRTEVEMAPKDI